MKSRTVVQLGNTRIKQTLFLESPDEIENFFCF